MRAIFKIDIRELYARQSSVPMNEPAYRFCPSCGGALEARLLKAGDPHRLVCAQCAFVLYLDPKVAVGTIIATGDERVVLVRRAIEPGYGLWVFPGGYVDRGEPVTTAAIREAREEAGLDVQLDGLVNIYSYPGVPLVIIVYAASILGGELCIDDECLEARLFASHEIPWPALAFRSTHDALTDYFAGRVRPFAPQTNTDAGPRNNAHKLR
jgi:8-oxo-dGTP diphosphatase